MQQAWCKCGGVDAAYLCGWASRNRPTAGSSLIILLGGRGLLMQLALLDKFQQGVALLAANHVIIYFELLLGCAQAL